MMLVAVLLLPIFANLAWAGKRVEFLGCYGEDTNDAVLPIYLGPITFPAGGASAKFKPMFNQCRKEALNRGLTYFAMQAKSKCYGGEKNTRYSKLGQSTNCIKGKDGYSVGDVGANAVYQIGDDGGWTEFTSWSEKCSKTCGGGVKIRTRCCTDPPPSWPGRVCSGKAYDIQSCNDNPCIVAVDGGWTPYGSWGQCSAKCGRGTQTRTRTCTNPLPSNGGRSCSGSKKDTRQCTGTDCEVGTEDNPGRSCKDIKEQGGTQSKVYWITLEGRPFEVYCDQSTDGGGWTLVWSYTFTNFQNFRGGSNAITPRPDWPAPGNTRVSITAPTSETDYNALKFNLWKELGTEFMIKSNINNWISCSEGSGSLINWRNGNLNCRLVKNIAGKCGNVVPNTIKMRTHDSWGWHELGPNIFDSRVRGWGVLKTYYYLETSTSGVNWPTHDPCGKNGLNHLRVADPHGNVYVR